MFIDTAKIHVQGGRGGNGCCSFRREKYVPHGGPDGGDGGNGGDVILVADKDVDTLLDFRYAPLIRGGNGEHGKGKNMTGRCGAETVAKVPAGTLIKDPETGEILADLVEPGDRFVAAKSGRGGRGNASYKTSTNRAPRQCEPGEEGEIKELHLELKLIADAGLVGFPNAGKSSLISVTCNVRPKIAPYPFTTLAPNLGVLILDDITKTIKIADVPGLIEGAHDNRGLGHQFLRHIERTKMLLYVLDMAGVDGRDPLEDFRTLRNELEMHDPAMLRKPFFVVCNKMDIPEAEDALKTFRKKSGVEKKLIFPVSCITKIGLEALVKAIESMYEVMQKQARIIKPAGDE